ncbi:hypothetical protein KBD08_00080 [Candidatus Babeliales bacterium]|nr:hypothetical protein [Candidatus Babeliales bacterium]
MFKGANIIHLMICFWCISLQPADNQNNLPEHFGQQNPIRTMRSPYSPIINPFPYGNPNSAQPKQPEQDKSQ